MVELNLVALATATIAAFAVSSTWYGLLGARMTALQSSQGTAEAPAAAPEPWKIGVELLRSLTVATALALLVSSLDVSALHAGLGIGLAAWITFPVTLLAGAVIWEGVPIELAAIHAGDWLFKLLAVTAIVTVWQ